MSITPKKRLHEDGGNGGGNYSHPSVSKYPHDDQETHSGVDGKVVAATRHDYHAPYDMGQEGRMPKIVPRNESRDADRRSQLLPNMLFRVSTPNDSHSDRVGSESRMEFKDFKDSIKEISVENSNKKSESRELLQTAKCEKYDRRADDCRDSKLDRDTYSEIKGNENLNKDGYHGSNSNLNWEDAKGQHRVKQYSDIPGENLETRHTSHTGLHGQADVAKECLHVDSRDFAEAYEAVGENRVDMKGEDEFKDKDRKRKEVKHWDWGEGDKERTDRRSKLEPVNSNSENKVVGEERDSEKWGDGKKEPLEEKEKLDEKKKYHVKIESYSYGEEASHNEIELVDIPGKSVEQESSTLEPKKKGHDIWKSVDKEARDRKKERDADVEQARPEKRSRYHEKGSDEGGLHAEGGTEWERETFNCGVQQRERMLRPRGSPQIGSRDPRFRQFANNDEVSQGKAYVSHVVYKIGESMQELLKLWKEYELLQADKAREGSQDGPTLEIHIPAEHVTAANRQVRGGQLWGTDVYTVDSDLVAVLMHTGYCRPTASPPPSSTLELRATIRVLPPQDCYISTLRNNVRSRAWGAAIGCSYRVECCCIVKKGGGSIDLEPCLAHSSTMEPTLAPVAVERTMTTRAAALNALRQQRFVREVTIQFNLCMEPWYAFT